MCINQHLLSLVTKHVHWSVANEVFDENSNAFTVQHADWSGSSFKFSLITCLKQQFLRVCHWRNKFSPEITFNNRCKQSPISCHILHYSSPFFVPEFIISSSNSLHSLLEDQGILSSAIAIFCIQACALNNGPITTGRWGPPKVRSSSTSWSASATGTCFSFT